MTPQFFITGTDTGVGKTWFTSWLVRSWQKQGDYSVGLKPIATGNREDAQCLYEANCGVLSLDEINPVFLQEAAAPMIAARVEGRRLDFMQINLGIEAILQNYPCVAVEGIGGWRVPLAPGYEVRDWARDLNLPVIVVALSRLGAINHTLLTVESIVALGLTCAGVVLNAGGGEQTAAANIALQMNAAVLASTLPLPVFQLDSFAEATGKIPSWLGGK